MFTKLEYPNSILVSKAASAWGVKLQYLAEFANRGVMTSAEIKKFVMKATTIAYPGTGKSKVALKELFTRFMVLSLRFPLIENIEIGVLQLFGRDYLRAEDESAYRRKCQELYDSLKGDWNGLQKYMMNYFRTTNEEYIAQIPKRVFIETLQEMPAGSRIFVDGRLKNTALGSSLILCCQKMGEMILMVPIVDRVSREIIESNPFLKSMSPVIGSLKMRKSVADIHTKLAVGG
jgi:hypothetical protein